MPHARSSLNSTDWLWLLVCGGLSTIWCLAASRELGATFDEPIYLERGLHGWRTFTHGGLLSMGTMPLPTDVQTLPLYLSEWWRGRAIDPVQEMEAVLPWMRAGNLVFWAILLFHGLLLGKALAGRWGGRLAVALLACEPNLLAHASLATTDLAVSACLLALVYHYRAGRNGHWKQRILVPALWFAATALAKASGLMFGTLCLLVLEFENTWNHRGTENTEKAEGMDSTILSHSLRLLCASVVPSLRRPAAIVGLGMLAVVGYCGTDGKPEASFVRWARQRPADTVERAVLVPVAENLRFFPNAFEGITRQVKHNLHGHSAYLLGQSDPRSFWYYFPVVLTIKLSIAWLLLPLIVALARPRALLNVAVATAALLLALSLTYRVQIGVRLILPLIALAGVGLAVGLEKARQAGGWRRGLVTPAALAGLTWAVLTAATVWPNGLCYANEFWGGATHAFRWVSDANYDWGQGLTQLHRWQRQHDVDCLHVWYYGTDRTIDRLPITPLQSASTPADLLAQARGGYLAVSTTLLYGPESDLPQRRAVVEFLRRRRPMARTMTFFIYDFTREANEHSDSEWCER